MANSARVWASMNACNSAAEQLQTYIIEFCSAQNWVYIILIFNWKRSDTANLCQGRPFIEWPR